MANIKDKHTPSVPRQFRLDLSQIEEFISLPSHTPFSKTLRTDLLSPTDRRLRVNSRSLATTWVLVHDLYIPVPQELREGTHVNICMELAPENGNHAHAWLKHSDSELLKRDDPALRLAIRYQVDSHDVNAADITNWLYFRRQEMVETDARHITLKRIFKLNSLVDFLDGDSTAEIARRPRRYVRLWTTTSGKRKWDGWYTSDT